MVVIIGIIALLAVRSLKTTHEVAKVEQTKKELDRLAWAIAGNPDMVSGGARTTSTNPDAKGNFSFSNIPIGLHTLRVIYLPDSDTVSYTVGIDPASTVKLSFVFPADLW